MNIRQFTGFCYDEIAEEMGFTRVGNEYYRVLDDVMMCFALELYASNRYFRALMGIIPLCSELPKKNPFGRIQIESAYFRHTGIECDNVFLSNFSMEKYISNRTYLINVFNESERPFFIKTKDLSSAFKTYQELHQYYFEGCRIIGGNFNINTDYWSFLLATKRFEEALENFNQFALFHEVDLLPEISLVGKLQRLLRDKNYDAVDSIMEERKRNNLEKLRQEKIIH